MQLVEGRLVLSASDLTGFLACGHLTQLELRAIRGEAVRPLRLDAELDILTRRGEEHEIRYLNTLEAQGRTVARMDLASGRDTQTTIARLVAAHDRTVAAMQGGAEVIYQAAFFDGRWIGYADFLLRTTRPSALGAFSYEVADTKLARKVKAAALLQMCSYAEHLGRIQGLEPNQLHVITGDGLDHPYRLSDYAAYYRSVKSGYEALIGAAMLATYPDPVSHCGVCRWSEVCDARRRTDDHLSLVAGLGREQTRKLMAAGITTVAQLAATAITAVPKIGQPTYERLREQACLQVSQRKSGEVSYKLLPPEPGRGFALLPEPSPGDLFFDMEGDPWAEDGGLEYLFGVVEVQNRKPQLHSFWGLDRVGEKLAFEQFIDFVMARWAAHPDLHVYHYASYEQTALKHLMGSHATREEEVDRLLRGGVLVDLFQVVRQAVRVSQESYSIKKLEPLYMGRREATITSGGSSIVAFEEWLRTGDQSVLDAIGLYNREDCESTWLLQGWLEARREEAEASYKQPIARPITTVAAPTPQLVEQERVTKELSDRLLEGIPDDVEARDATQAGRQALAHLLSWHRREAKPEWWAYYHRFTLGQDELFEDTESIAGLQFTGVSRDEKLSAIREYRFDPSQEHKLEVGHSCLDPSRRAYAGTIEALDNERGIVALKKKRSADPDPPAIVAGGPLSTSTHEEALRRLAKWVIANGIDGAGSYRAARDLVLARPPRTSVTSPGDQLTHDGEDGLAACRRLAGVIGDGVLPIQGPPGSGKTYAAAWMIVDLLRAGKKVGITAHGHKAITNLLAATCERATAEGLTFKAIQRAPLDESCDSAAVTTVEDNDDVDRALADRTVHLVTGTSWLFTRPQLDQAVDVLFIDEAGQLSLANAVAVSMAARSVVMLGDPNQLSQPSKGTHPQGVGVSGLEHLLRGSQTIPPERGIFLETTRRLHPDVCAFISEVFYEGRLVSDPSCSQLSLRGGGPLGPSGVRYSPVEHLGNRITAPEEVERVSELFRSVLGRPWVDRAGISRLIAMEDILVVAPYNVHVRRLRDALPDGARVGTVDKFQGQEAAVVFFSMASSSIDDIPRNMEFLYSLNRLNVAISRALVLAVLVCSPTLLRVKCRTPEQMRLVNALCRLVELAGEQATSGSVALPAPRPPALT